MGVVVRDPGITIGRYRVVLQSDLRTHVLVHEDQPKDGSVSAICRSKEDAIAEAERLMSKGGKCLIVNPAPVLSRRQELAEDGADQSRPRLRVNHQRPKTGTRRKGT